MKNKTIFSKLLLIAFLASFLLQTAHSIEHFVLEPIKEICNHTNTTNSKNQITHTHDVQEQCNFCNFSISSFVANSFDYHYTFDSIFNYIASLFFKEINIIYYKGSLFALRAPPSLH